MKNIAKTRILNAINNKISSISPYGPQNDNLIVLYQIKEAVQSMNYLQCHKMEESLIQASLNTYKFHLKYGNGSEKMEPVSPLNFFSHMPTEIRKKYELTAKGRAYLWAAFNNNSKL